MRLTKKELISLITLSIMVIQLFVHFHKHADLEVRDLNSIHYSHFGMPAKLRFYIINYGNTVATIDKSKILVFTIVEGEKVPLYKSYFELNLSRSSVEPNDEITVELKIEPFGDIPQIRKYAIEIPYEPGNKYLYKEFIIYWI